MLMHHSVAQRSNDSCAYADTVSMLVCSAISLAQRRRIRTVVNVDSVSAFADRTTPSAPVNAGIIAACSSRTTPFATATRSRGGGCAHGIRPARAIWPHATM
jgi:hypothetical protein